MANGGRLFYDEFYVGTTVRTSFGDEMIVEVDWQRERARVISGRWYDMEELNFYQDQPDLRDPDALEEWLEAPKFEIRRPTPTVVAESLNCSCPCGQTGTCYRVSTNGFHMTNTGCRCAADCDGCKPRDGK